MHSDVTLSGISNDISCAAWNQMQNNKVHPDMRFACPTIRSVQIDLGAAKSAAVPHGAILTQNTHLF